jgi:hypothetical protein
MKGGVCLRLSTVAALLMMTATSAYAADRFAGAPPPADLSQWKERVAVKPWSEEGTCANHGYGGEWRVVLGHEGILVRQYQRAEATAELPFSRDHIVGRTGFRAGRLHAIPVADGFLIGADAGEFGGGIWWFSASGDRHHHLLDANVIGFARIADEILAVDGLAHLTLRHGAVHSLDRDEATRQWRVRRTVDLGTAAELFVPAPPDTLLVLTIDGLVQYQAGETKRLLKSDYSILYPNSIARTVDGHVFVGMRYAVVEVAPDGAKFRERWLVPPKCMRLVRVSGAGCKCR